MVEMELTKLVISEQSDSQKVVLKEKNGTRKLSILIGIQEALAISRGLNQERFARPLTHDLIWNILNGMDAELEKVVVSDLRESELGGVFYATLHVLQGERSYEIDCRPSDAISVAVQVDPPTPIFVEEHVLELAGE